MINITKLAKSTAFVIGSALTITACAAIGIAIANPLIGIPVIFVLSVTAGEALEYVTR